jgi:hypothetical protein
MTTYIFESEDILKSRILDSSYSETIMSTSTTSNLLYRKATVIEDAVSHRALATINWSGKAFEISGMSKKVSGMKTKPGGFKDSNWKRTWQWDPSSPVFNVEYRHRKWTATNTSTGKISAVFKSLARHTLAKPDPAHVTFARDLPDMEQLFLLMVLLRMEARRLDTDTNQPQDQSYGQTDSSSQHAVQVEFV